MSESASTITASSIVLQHVNVKLLLRDNAMDLSALIPVFHEWIERQARPELLLDVADYTHVPAGPGVVLIGHQADYSVDNTNGRLGVRYNRKAEVEGTNQDALRQAAQAALEACRQLEEDSRLKGKLEFEGKEIDAFINDRLLAPNTEESRQAAGGELEAFFRGLFRGAEFSLSFDTDPRRLFRVTAKSTKPFTSSDLLKNLRA